MTKSDAQNCTSHKVTESSTSVQSTCRVTRLAVGGVGSKYENLVSKLSPNQHTAIANFADRSRWRIKSSISSMSDMSD